MPVPAPGSQSGKPPDRGTPSTTWRGRASAGSALQQPTVQGGVAEGVEGALADAGLPADDQESTEDDRESAAAVRGVREETGDGPSLALAPGQGGVRTPPLHGTSRMRAGPGGRQGRPGRCS
ncbi:hypothetical protein GCM10022285_53980 [Streptomyces tunisiensis]|uniref:Uncharacterized protein n=1 Tax=Streptomyces tunisiensis TaxID=948699 RepID=A0ABP7Z5G0_9ACTN